MIANYHTHTKRCRHGHGEDEEFVQSALERGLQILGFSDHTPYLFSDDYYSTFRMFPEEFPDYVKYISRIFPDKKTAFSDKEVASSKCYLCHRNLKKTLKWFSPNGKHYYCVAFCEKHGYLKGKIRVRKVDEGGLFIVKTTKFISEAQVQELIDKKENKKPENPEEVSADMIVVKEETQEA